MISTCGFASGGDTFDSGNARASIAVAHRRSKHRPLWSPGRLTRVFRTVVGVESGVRGRATDADRYFCVRRVTQRRDFGGGYAPDEHAGRRPWHSQLSARAEIRATSLGTLISLGFCAQATASCALETPQFLNPTNHIGRPDGRPFTLPSVVRSPRFPRAPVQTPPNARQTLMGVKPVHCRGSRLDRGANRLSDRGVGVGLTVEVASDEARIDGSPVD